MFRGCVFFRPARKWTAMASSWASCSGRRRPASRGTEGHFNWQRAMRGTHLSRIGDRTGAAREASLRSIGKGIGAADHHFCRRPRRHRRRFQQATRKSVPYAAPLCAGIFLLPYSPSQSRPSAINSKGDPEAAYRNPLIGKGGFGGCTRTISLFNSINNDTQNPPVFLEFFASPSCAFQPY